ncbi:hypothetical protein [Leptospira santarosai]|uniref:hypothetical protein n=1 Tax=Leptospira santarosai TaxID=28183 RepID=UPI0002BA9628|nr:hypothetical protein [Leptospira santarosai]EMF91289.1 hypothetical protein LEP1GSC005_1056 [Leptospira santarosai str. ST188]EMO72837.1 hypothetical protein LEP1GSC130_1865 [Leptospira santarosai str. 200403458]EMO99701.1 hypothetical protein LEP1GSC120_0991 [Leptospira santarosai str. 200702252]
MNNNESVTKTIRDNVSGSVQTNITKSGFTETRTTTVPVWTHSRFPPHIALSLRLAELLVTPDANVEKF